MKVKKLTKWGFLAIVAFAAAVLAYAATSSGVAYAGLRWSGL